MADEKSFVPFLVFGVIMFLLALVFILATNPVMTRWMDMALKLVSILSNFAKSAVSEAM